MATNPNLDHASQSAGAEENRRRHARIEVALPAFLHAGEDRRSVQIVDLSPGGARLAIDVPFAVGTPIALDIGSLARAAIVRWEADHLMGIAFDIELEEREFAAQVTRSMALSAWIKSRG